ncbi:STAS domain-containing protein [Actinomarinicola tropica]|uniref:STAS domain-containing protein n=2 Tax=Actinomarinicola tropica TaxID=2789776 RepID=A0A5Q2RNH4_9ACTN|nr:STAS domain-containing protein [Actinomarinicola tropica]
MAGLTVGVVALPLALAFGITTGLGAAAGLTTAIVAGLVAAVFGGSHVQVSGPTGAMTVVLVPLVARHGADAVVVVGVIAGLFVVVASALRLGRLLAYIPWPVIEGFTLGIAVIIFLQQVPAALGVATPEGENTAIVAVRAALDALDHGSFAALLLVGLVVAVMVLAPRLHRSLPASLLAVVAATSAVKVVGLDVATIGALPSTLPAPSLPAVDLGVLGGFIGPAFAVALLAAIESLLSAKVADGMVDGPRHDPDRELFGQGLANVVSPLFGGMPATGAIARTAVNVRAGARTRLASVVHSLALVAVVLAGSDLVAEIPLAALAGVLVVTAMRMVEVHNIRSILRSTRSDAAVLGITAAATIVFDLVVAVEVGVAVAAVLALRQVARTTALAETPVPAEVDPEDEESLLHEHIVAYRIDGALFFGASQRFLASLSQVADVRVVILRLPDLQVLDATGAHALGEIVADLERRHITVLLKGPRPEHERLLRNVGALDHLASEHHLFTDLDAAVAHARLHASGAGHDPTCRPPSPRAA